MSRSVVVCSSLPLLLVLLLGTPIAALAGFSDHLHTYEVFRSPHDTPLQHMVVDTELESGRVYLGGVDYLYQLSADLQKVEEVRTGPELDAPECPATRNCPPNAMLQSESNYNKALAIYAKQSKLVVCGSLFQGSCELRNLYNISIADATVVQRGIVANSQHPSTVAFVGPGPPDPGHDQVLYVASTFTNRGSFRDQVPAVASLSLQRDTLFELAGREAFAATSISVERSRRENYLIDYITGFSSGNFSYFISHQPSYDNAPGLGATDPKISKLIRVCNRDARYYSYTEVPLYCVNSEGQNYYNLVQGAYVTKPGFNLAHNLGISTNDDVLFAIFTHAGGPNSPPVGSSPPNSALCVYPLKYIEEIFMENILVCAQGNAVRGLDFMKKRKGCQKMTFPEGSDPACGNEVNYPLGGLIPVQSRYSIRYDGTELTAVAATTAHAQTVVFAGTSNGHLKKILVVSSTEAEEYDDILVQAGETILQDMHFDISGQYIYVLTKSSVTRVKLQECRVIDRCTECLSARDPFCGWCQLENKCSVQTDCKRQWLGYQDQQCTAITMVKPAQIHYTRSKYLALTVQNLPEVSGQLSCVFTFGNVRLRTGAQSPPKGSNELSCTTPQTSHLPSIPNGQHHLDSILSIEVDSGPDIAATNFTFYDCSTYASCADCVSSPFACDWCAESAKCTETSEDHCRQEHIINGLNRVGPSSRKGPQFCPSIASSEPEIFVSAGETRSVVVQLENALDFMTSFECLFTIGPSVDRKKAKLNGDQLYCDEMNFSFYGTKTPNVTARLDVVWQSGRALDNPQSIRVVIYKCENLAENCGLCLQLLPQLNCGWCSTRGECATRQKCLKPDETWLDRSETCPNPRIISFTPTSGPVQGGTRIRIEGANLGKAFSDIRNSVEVNKVACNPIAELYEPSKSITCITDRPQHEAEQSGPVVVKLKEGRKFVAISEAIFHFVNPEITSFTPLQGPVSGGTRVDVEGRYLNSGSNVSMTIGGVPCVVLAGRSPGHIQCITGRSDSAKAGGIWLKIDQAERSYAEKQFSYSPDPTVTKVFPLVSTVSGGLILRTSGSGFNLIQDPKFIVRLDNEDYFGPCTIESDKSMICQTPSLFSAVTNRNLPTASRPLTLEFGLQLDGVETSKNLTTKLGYGFKVYPDPEFHLFESEDRVKHYKDDFLTIHGENIDLAARESDITIWIGDRLCNLTATARKALTCRPPEKQPQPLSATSDWPEVIVSVGGGNRNYTVGYLSYQDPLPHLTIVAIVVAVGLFILALMVVVVAYRRKSTRHLRQMKHLQEQIVNIELKVATECKEAFAELQTDMTEFQADMTGQGIPFLPYRDYALRILFPTTTQELVPHPQGINAEKGLRMLNQLLMNKTFLLCLVRTLEASRYFLGRDRVHVGSILMVILQEKLEYCTEILKTLLAELIERTMERRLQPRILFRRSESVAERMLGAWFSFLMHRYLLECAGQPLFTLYWGIRQQVEKGPQDAITHDARYSLSEQKLLRQSLEFHSMTVFVTGPEGQQQQVETPVRVLDCDTISQVKDKCLDALYRTTPYSIRPPGQDLDLEWRSGVSGRLVLQDLDMTTKTEHGEWKRLNTLAHYKVPTNACLALVPKQSSVFNLNTLMSEHSQDKSFRSLSTFSLKNSPTLARGAAGSPHSTPIHQKDPEAGYKIYHLVKPQDTDFTPQDRMGKMVSEIYLTRLLTTKGTLQKFVEDLFETIFSTAHRCSALPLCVKYMFDFLDDQALQHGIVDSETVHAWKSNSLPLRFWVNLIKNPQFVFDVAKPTKIEGCLSVVAQTLMDSCSTQDHQLTKDSPSSKLLFARDIPLYRDWVDRYYTDIRMLPSVSDQDMNAFLADESRQHQQEFPVFSALYQLHRYVAQYKDQILTNLEEDEFSRRSKLPHKFLQYLRLMDEDISSPAT